LFCHKYGYTICTERDSETTLQEINIGCSYTAGLDVPLAWEENT